MVLLSKGQVSEIFSLFQLQKSKEREERLEEVIQAYEKIHLEKSNVQRDLDKMVNTQLHRVIIFDVTVFGSSMDFSSMNVFVCVRRL